MVLDKLHMANPLRLPVCHSGHRPARAIWQAEDRFVHPGLAVEPALGACSSTSWQLCEADLHLVAKMRGESLTRPHFQSTKLRTNIFSGVPVLTMLPKLS